MVRRRNHRSRSRNRSPASFQNTFPENEVSFRDLSLYPQIEEIHSSKPKLCAIKTKGAYRSVEHYLDVNFKVLREDFVNPLRDFMKKYRYRSQSQMGVVSLNVDNDEVYKKVKFVSHNRLCFDVEDKIKEVDWSSTKRFMTGNLLIITSNNFESFFLATVSNTDVNDLKKKFITVDLVDKDQSKFVTNKFFTMIESESFFTPYYHVLKALQEFDESNFPFRKYFVDVNLKQQPPGYLNVYEVYNISTETKKVSFKVLNDSDWPTSNQLGLDNSQFRALKAALTNELVVIQGPPGTGKTFIGRKIVEVLLANRRVWNLNSTPILVVCFTNHALDQFLEALLSLTNNIVRVGKSDGGKLEKYNLREKRKQFAQNDRRQNEMAVDLKILRSALVVGATTTLAAKQRELFSYVAPKIVIVEEAAEVLEAHILASLTAKCQHLIMIGDHKQLRPNVNEAQSKRYKLDVSLFERLIINGMPHHMLNLQHRMRPEISEPLVRTIYPSLQNHPSVFQRDPIKGMVKNVFFMTHSNPEIEADGTSKRNDFEATMLLHLANYLIKQGYKPEEITILATYKAQTNYMEEKRLSAGLPSEIRITTVDNFQGEENKIILLSLVRSNLQKDIGFLKIDNRICVALSRARDGFFIVGNMSCMVARSPVWTVIRDTLVESQSYGTTLSLCCQVHKEKITPIARAADFTAVAHGGCASRCGQKLRCGHSCKSRCHGPLALKSAHGRCKEPCARALCSRGHRCSKMCYQPCDRCVCQVISNPVVDYRSTDFLPIVAPPPVLRRVSPIRTVRAPEPVKRWWQCCTVL